ncbi:MAG: CrcB family protein [Acidimicrobiia bacterium]|nr:CrcB family protein [Acidimicrobiia bacterium]
MTPAPARLLALAAVAGATLRWLVFTTVPDTDFPWAILAVNLAGCALLGWFVVRPLRADHRHQAMTVGFCGGLTTFSTFAVELADLRADDPTTMWLYLLTSVVGGMAAFVAARAVAGAM